MPIITIKYDESVVSDDEVRQLSVAAQKTVSEVTQIEDVFVYADSPKISLKIAPIEIFVQISAHKVDDLELLSTSFRTSISAWKVETNFSHPINLTVIPMEWNVSINV